MEKELIKKKELQIPTTKFILSFSTLFYTVFKLNIPYFIHEMMWLFEKSNWILRTLCNKLLSTDTDDNEMWVDD